jgi:hypothetical protein
MLIPHLKPASARVGLPLCVACLRQFRHLVRLSNNSNNFDLVQLPP